LTINHKEITQHVLDFNPQVRFAGIANSKGELVAGGQKPNVEKMLVGDEVKMSIHYALQKRDLYTNLAYKIGHEKSSITEYDLVTMITIPLNSQELFLISTEPRAEYLKIIDYVLSEINSEENEGD